VSEDPIDRLIAGWSAERPDLDASAMALIARLLRVSARVDGRVADGLRERGLQPGWFDVLSALRRAGKPYRLSPGRLASTVILSTGGMTKRLDRMQDARLIRRSPDPEDRRALLVELTPAGLRAVDGAIEAHLDAERRILGGLSRSEQAELERLLRLLDASIS